MTLRSSPEQAAASASARCPVCGKPPILAARPFCSTRCADIDLGRWLTGQYRIAVPPSDQDDDPPPIADHDPGVA
jgi:uncharacterized protein